MEPSSNAARCKVKFDFCIKSLSMVFNKEVQALDVDKFPIVIVLSKGEHRVATQPTKLLLGKANNHFLASWKDAILQVVLTMESIDKMFTSKKIKLSINVAPEHDTSKPKSLATVNFDLATLRLAFVDKTVKEKKLLCLKPVRRASETIISVEMLLDVRHTPLMETYAKITSQENELQNEPWELSPLSSPEPVETPREICPPKPKRSGLQLTEETVPGSQSRVEESHLHAQQKESDKVFQFESPKLSSVKQKRDKKTSLANLLRPTQNSTHQLTSSKPSTAGAEGMAYFRFHDLLGIVRVRIRGMTLPEEEQTSVVPETGVGMGEKATPNGGVYCIMSVTGGNTRSSSSIVPVYPNRPIIFSENEKEHMFYTNQSRQLFILCRKIALGSEVLPSTPSTTSVAAISDDDPCIGAANFHLTNCSPAKVSDIGTIDEVSKESDVLLSLEPKGSIQLGICFTPLLPRCRMSCEGVITILCASNLNVSKFNNFDVSCTVKLDRDVLDTTSPAPSNEYSTEGWRTEGISFVANNSLDLDIQLWAYSEDGTTTWCGICILPVSFIVPLREIVNTSQMQYLPNGDPMVNLSQTYKERLLLDLEPQGQIEVYLSLKPRTKVEGKPLIKNDSSTHSSSKAEEQGGTTTTNAISLKRTATLRRKKKRIISQPDCEKEVKSKPSDHSDKPKEGSKLQKWTEPPKINSSSPEMTEMDVIQENLDLKREE